MAQAESLLGGPVSLTGSGVPPYRGDFIDMNHVRASSPPSNKRYTLSAPPLSKNNVIPLHDTVSFGRNASANTFSIEGVSLDTWEPLPIPAQHNAPVVPPVFLRQRPHQTAGRFGDSPSSELSMPDALL